MTNNYYQTQNMFKIGTASILIFIILNLSAQGNINELKKKLHTAQSDTTRLRISLLIGDKFQAEGSDSALFYYRNALTLVDNLTEKTKHSNDENRNIIYKKAQALKEIGSYYADKYENDSSLVYYSESIKLFQYLADTEKDKKKKENFLDILANTLLTTGGDYFDKNNFVQATECYRQVIAIGEELNDSLTLSKGILNLGMILNTQGKYGEAISNYFTAIKIFEQRQDKKGIAICHLSIGNILRKQNTLEKAIDSYKKALEIFKEINDERGQYSCYNNLGICYASLSNYEKSLEFYNKALAIHQKNGNEDGIAMMYSNISALYQTQGNLDKATEYILKSLKINEKIRNSRHLLGSYINLASIYYEKAIDSMVTVTRRKEYTDKSIQYAKKGLDLVDTLHLVMEKANVLNLLKDAYSLNENYKKAYEMATVLISINDSLYNSEKTKIIAETETKYETDKKEHEIQRQKLELQEQQLKLSNARIFRNSLAVATALMIVVILLIYRNYKQKNKANRILDQKNRLIEKQNEEILKQSDGLQTANKKLTDLLQFKERMTGMIVHDLKNPLSNILNSYLIPDNDFREQLITQSGYDMLKLVENILDVYKLEETEMKIEKELVDIHEMLRMNLVETALYIKEKELTMNLPQKDIPAIWADKRILKRIFSNLLSNAVKYSPQSGTIYIRFEIINGKDTRISIYNQGPAIPMDKQEQIFEKFRQHESRNIGITTSTGLGLSFCKMAVEAHDGEIGVISEDEGAEFWFILPDSLSPDSSSKN